MSGLVSADIWRECFLKLEGENGLVEVEDVEDVETAALYSKLSAFDVEVALGKPGARSLTYLQYDCRPGGLLIRICQMSRRRPEAHDAAAHPHGQSQADRARPGSQSHADRARQSEQL
jgi:hypothetical protein